MPTVLKQISGESLRVREGSPRGFLQGGNYVSAQFQSMESNGDMRFQLVVFTEKPVLDAAGELRQSGGDSEGIGILIKAENIPSIKYDNNLSFIENAQKKALPCAAIYLKQINMSAEFSEETI